MKQSDPPTRAPHQLLLSYSKPDACLLCGKDYSIEKEVVKKFISQKCSHHYCGDCITLWRKGWDEDGSLNKRKMGDGTDVLTKACLHPRCDIHHDRLPGTDRNFNQQSYVADKYKFTELLFESVQLSDSKRDTSKKKKVPKHQLSSTCG